MGSPFRRVFVAFVPAEPGSLNRDGVRIALHPDLPRDAIGINPRNERQYPIAYRCPRADWRISCRCPQYREVSVAEWKDPFGLGDSDRLLAFLETGTIAPNRESSRGAR